MADSASAIGMDELIKDISLSHTAVQKALEVLDEAEDIDSSPAPKQETIVESTYTAFGLLVSLLRWLQGAETKLAGFRTQFTLIRHSMQQTIT